MRAEWDRLVVQPFGWAVETFVFYPVATHILSLGFLTTSHFFDALGLGAVSTAGFVGGRYVLCSVYGACAFAAFVCFVIRAAKIAWPAAMPVPGLPTSL